MISPRKKLIGNEQGMILVVSLLILALLIGAGVGAIVATQNDLKITANLRRGAEAFYVAEAGLAWGKAQVSRVALNPPLPPDSGRSVPAGRFAVSFLAPELLGGLAGRVVIRSTGESGTSSSLLEARITKIYDLADGALSIKGNDATITFRGNSFTISGLDHQVGSKAVPLVTKSRPGISVNESLLNKIQDGLTHSQRDAITGKDERGAAVAATDLLPADVLTKLATQLCELEQTLRRRIGTGEVLALSGLTLGSRLRPELHCMDGLARPGQMVSLASSRGAGILVVKNADLLLTGNFRWEGLILLTGEHVSFKAVGNGDKEIYGSVVIADNTAPGESGRLGIDIQGAFRLMFSRAALLRSAELVPRSIFASIYGFLPAVIHQDYWRLLTP